LGTELEACQPGCGNETGTPGTICSHIGHFQDECDELLDVFSVSKLRPDDDFISFERAGGIFPIGLEYKSPLAGAFGVEL
jgi:hypothetical protein